MDREQKRKQRVQLRCLKSWIKRKKSCWRRKTLL